MMKKIFLALLVLYFGVSAIYAQQTETSLAKQRWQGEWQGVAGSDLITLYIIQAVHPAEKEFKEEVIGLYGWHSIKQKGVVVESSIENSSDQWNDRVTITSRYKHLSDSIYLVIKDITRNNLLGAYMILINENEAILKTWMKENWRNDGKEYPDGQTFPKEIRLVRISTIIKSI